MCDILWSANCKLCITIFTVRVKSHVLHQFGLQSKSDLVDLNKLKQTGGGVLPEKLGGDVQPASQNP